MGNLHFFHRLVIDYGYCLDLLTISLENSRVFCFPSIIVKHCGYNCFSLLLGATYILTKNVGTSNVQILPFLLQIQQCNE